MNNKVLYILLVIVFSTAKVIAQNESLTSSPYSLYGLGIHNSNQIGKWNGMASAGLAYSSPVELNNMNPASYAAINKYSFLYDIGAKGGYNTFQNKRGSDNTVDFNFSDIAMGFSIRKNLGVGLTLLPYSSVGYTLSGITTNIEGSSETYNTNVVGYGGLNNFQLNIGYQPFKNVRIGLSSAFLFGNINESEYVQVSSSYFYMVKNQFYKGIKLGVGLQVQPSEKLSFGAIVNVPTNLAGSMKRDITKYIDGVEITIESDRQLNTNGFKLPLEMGGGFNYKLMDNKLNVNADYYKKLWGSTEQKDKVGTYQDQDIINVGAEYLHKMNSEKYFQRVRYRLGYSYDSGYLLINDKNVATQNFTLGLGLPLSIQNYSTFNISYTYGQRGHIQNQMVKENYHLITLNLSLENVWFLQRKIE